MKCRILHESRGRMRVHLACARMSLDEADILEAYLKSIPGVTDVKIYDRTQDAVICYAGQRSDITTALARFRFGLAELDKLQVEHSVRRLNRDFEDRLIMTVVGRAFRKIFLPAPVRAVLTVIKSARYIWKGLKSLKGGKLKVEVLDAVAVGVSMLRGSFDTAASVMFMLKIGEILDDWTHKKSVADLASAMALNVDRVWLLAQGQEVLVSLDEVQPGDSIVVRTGNMIPLDGRVASGEAMVNQASMTGESLPVRKTEGSLVYAGTVVEDGQCVIAVEKTSGSGRYDRIVRMIEESEKLKSASESRAADIADRLVPYTLGGTVLTYLLTRNVTKALAVLMVDVSCALKLAMPITVISAMRECQGGHHSLRQDRHSDLCHAQGGRGRDLRRPGRYGDAAPGGLPGGALSAFHRKRRCGGGSASGSAA